MRFKKDIFVLFHSLIPYHGENNNWKTFIYICIYRLRIKYIEVYFKWKSYFAMIYIEKTIRKLDLKL